ncbi:hypothetical protein EDD37DRAFT_145523 [Exophiala viscosa]|uniref:uncharacterized protein n=1 Tax=Exophiala viscosa TaxID=2486360 RepID=UPI0021929A5A|nr:hypothetical protein EDD37DRAFT_145523 [Exophiala viscosa]
MFPRGEDRTVHVLFYQGTNTSFPPPSLLPLHTYQPPLHLGSIKDLLLFEDKHQTLQSTVIITTFGLRHKYLQSTQGLNLLHRYSLPQVKNSPFSIYRHPAAAQFIDPGLRNWGYFKPTLGSHCLTLKQIVWWLTLFTQKSFLSRSSDFLLSFSSFDHQLDSDFYLSGLSIFGLRHDLLSRTPIRKLSANCRESLSQSKPPVDISKLIFAPRSRIDDRQSAPLI